MANCLYTYRGNVTTSESRVQDMVSTMEFREGTLVDTTTGETINNSELFTSLASIPLMSENEALDAYKYNLSSRVAEAFGRGKVNHDQLTPQQNAILSAIEDVDELATVYLTEGGTFSGMQEATFPVRPFVQDANGTVTDISEFSHLIDENGEPKPVFRTGNNTYTDYKTALQNAQGSPIQVGLEVPVKSTFFPLYEMTSSTNPETVEGAINQGILEGILHHEKVATGDGFAYRGKGDTAYEQHLNAHSFAQSLNNQREAEIATVSEHDFITIEDRDIDTLVTVEGEYTPAELWDILVKEGGDAFRAKFGDESVRLAYMAIQSKDPILPNREDDYVSVHETPAREDFELMEIVFDLLNSLGISVVSISDYIEKYNQRFGKDPDISAIADIGRRVLALSENAETDISIITEELAHFILEAYENQEELLSLTDEVKQTREWAEHNQAYYQKYSEKYSGEQLDNLVVREILGKLLSNRLRETQSEVEVSGTPLSLAQRLFKVFTDFLERIRSFFSPEIKTNLENVLTEISEKILDKSIMDYIDTANLDRGELMMYNIEDRRAIVALRKAVDTLERQLVSLTQNRDPQVAGVRATVTKAKAAMDETARKNLTEEIINTNEWIAIRSVVASISSLITPLRVKVEASQNYKVTQEDLQILQEAIPYGQVLAELKEVVKKSDYATHKQREQLVRTIENLNTEISSLNPQVSMATSLLLESHIDSYLEVTNFSEEEKEEYRRMFYQNQEDISWFTRYYGFLQHQSNVFLNSLGWLINKMHFNANKEYVNVITPFLDKVEKLGFNKSKYEALIQRKEDGKFSRFFVGPYNMAKFYEDLELAQLKALNTALGTSMTLEEYKRNKKQGKVKSVQDLTLDEQRVYNDTMNEWYLENTERRHTAEFYEEQEALWNSTYVWEEADVTEGDFSASRGEVIKLSEDTRNRLNDLNARRAAILNKYRGKDGRVDYVALSENIGDSTLLDLFKIERDNLKSTFDASTKERKTGMELKVAKDLEFIDNYYQEKFSLPRDISEDFWDKAKQVLKDAQSNIPDSDPLKQKKVNKAVMTFLMSNGGFTFSDAYWGERVDGSLSYLDKVEAMLEIAGDRQVEEALMELRELLIIRQELTKKYRDRNDLTDVMFENITVTDLEAFSTTESRIQELNRQVKSYADSISWNIPEFEIDSETTLNDAYSRALNNSDKTEFSFLKDHMTSYDANSMNNFKMALDEYSISGELPKFVVRFLSREYGLKDKNAVYEFLDSTDISPESLAIIYGRKKVLSYFKRNTPQGYSRLMNGIEAGVINIGEVLEELEYSHKGLRPEDGTVLDHLRLRPNYQWFEETVDDKLNPNYDENFRGGRLQPKMDKYLDQSTFDRYGADINHFRETREFKATRNLEEYGVLQDIYDLMTYAIDKYKMGNYANIYQLPQFSKSSLERTEQTLKGKGITTMTNAVRDFMKNRVDDLGYGERDGDRDIRDFSDVRVRPKYGLRLLEEETDISHEITYSLGRMVQLAVLDDARSKVEAEATMLEQKIAEKTQTKKSGGVSRASIMAKDYVDYYIYGVGRTQKVEVMLGQHRIDLTKIAMNFERYVRKINLGFNPAIAATAYTTSEIWLQMEGALGEYMGPGALRWANTELPKLVPEYIANVGKISNTSKMKLLQERFMVSDVSERTERSGYNRVLRATGDLSFKMLEMTDIPVLNRVMLALMKDNRVVGNRLMNYNEFAKQAKQDGKTNSEIKAEWKAVENQSVYELMEIKDGKAAPVEATKTMFEGMPEDYFEKKLDQLGMKLNSVHSFVDGRMSPMDRVAATRNLLVFTIAHRSWALIALARTFKQEHFNAVTGQWEKGHVRSFGTYFKNLFGELNAKTYDNMLEAIKQEWHTLDDVDKKNIQRLLTHTGVLLSLLLIGIAVAKAADDDDNKDEWGLQFAAYIYFRTVNELSSQHFPLGVTETVQMARAPFMALQNVEEFINPKNYSFDSVQSGPYAGLPRVYRHLAKQTFLRHYYDTSNIAQKSSFYRVNNANNLLWLGK